MPTLKVLLLGGQGYIGSALGVHLQRCGFDVLSIDPGIRGTHRAFPNRQLRYQELSARELDSAQAVVLVGGDSTVSACSNAPFATFKNNVLGFADLVHKLRGQMFIYASSVSVYVHTNHEANEQHSLPEPVTAYDYHKQSIEHYARLAYPNSYGLRFGTVAGPSPNLRAELLLNGLVRSAIHDGYVSVSNAHCHRPILGIQDLCRAVVAILTTAVPPGRYNLASMNVRIGELAELVARRFRVPLRETDGATPYDIRVSTSLFRSAADFEFQDSVDSIISALESHFLAGESS